MSLQVSKLSRIIFFTTFPVSLFWLLTAGFEINIYKHAVVGAIFELLWLPVIVLSFILPVCALIFWVRERFKLNSLNAYALLFMVVTVVFIFYKVALQREFVEK